MLTSTNAKQLGLPWSTSRGLKCVSYIISKFCEALGLRHGMFMSLSKHGVPDWSV